MPKPFLLKRAMPRSLFWRAFMILVIPILALQGIVATVFIQRLYDGVTEQMVQSVAREIGHAARAVEQAPDIAAAEARLSDMSRPFGFAMTLVPGQRVEPQVLRPFYDLTAGVIADTLRNGIDRAMRLDFRTTEKSLDLTVHTDRGALAAQIPRAYMNASNPHQLVVWMTVSALVLTAMATVFLRNQIRPIRDLARASAAFGRGRQVPFRPRGAEEVRRAGHAFLDMRARIDRHIGQRTLMLSGVSHDLRTPLTRIRLALAMSDPTPEAEEIARDVREMERMLDAFLDFVRGESGEAAVPVDPMALAAEVAADAHRGGAAVEVTFQGESEAVVALRLSAMRRCLANLLENAARHAPHVHLTARLTRRALEFVIEDDGPGIPPERREEALRPFTRLDVSRNQDESAGTGLGLAIALDIARSHGGSMTLDDSPALGGLRVTVHLPR